jgi:hypothetical protein
MCSEEEEEEIEEENDDEDESWKPRSLPTVEIYVKGGRLNTVELVADIPIDWTDAADARRRLVSTVAILTDAIPHASLSSSDRYYRKDVGELVLDPDTGKPVHVEKKPTRRRKPKKEPNNE